LRLADDLEAVVIGIVAILAKSNVFRLHIIIRNEPAVFNARCFVARGSGMRMPDLFNGQLMNLKSRCRTKLDARKPNRDGHFQHFADYGR
jgi:hypothetical protein